MLAHLLLMRAALGLDLWVPDPAEAPAVAETLAEVWPKSEARVVVGLPPREGEAAWWHEGVMGLRWHGVERHADPASPLATQILLLRSWVEAPFDPGPPPPDPVPPVLTAQVAEPLHAAHLLPSAGAQAGLEVGVSTAVTASFETASFEGASRGFAPVLDLAAALGPVRATATVWNLWEPERDYRPMLLGGLGVLVVDRPRWRLMPWAGVAMGWKRTEWYIPRQDPTQAGAALSTSASIGPGGVVGLGISIEVEAGRLVWDLSLPLLGSAFWRAEWDPETLSVIDPANGPARRRSMLLFPYPEAGVTWRLTPTNTMRFGLLASVPSLALRHAWPHAFVEAAAATSLGIGEVGDGEMLLGAAMRLRAGVAL